MIFAATGSKRFFGHDAAREHIAGPGAIAKLARGERVVQRQARSAEGEVAGQRVRRRRLAGEGGRFLLDQLLVPEEEEGLVAAVVELRDQHRPADAGIRLHEPGGHAVGRSRLRVGGLEYVEELAVRHHARAAEVGCHPVQRIGAALLDHADHAARGVAVFGGKCAGQYLYFVHRVLHRLDVRAGAGYRIVAKHAIFKDRRARGSLPGNVEAAERAAVGVAVLRHAGVQVQGIEHVPLVERHLVQGLALGQRSGRRGLGLQQRTLGRNLDRVGQLAEFHPDVHRQDVARPKIQSGLHHPLESRGLEGQAVQARLQRLDAIEPLGVGRDPRFEVGVDMDDGDLHIRDGGPLRVGHRSRDGPGVHLAERRYGKAQTTRNAATAAIERRNCALSDMECPLPNV